MNMNNKLFLNLITQAAYAANSMSQERKERKGRI